MAGRPNHNILKLVLLLALLHPTAVVCGRYPQLDLLAEMIARRESIPSGGWLLVMASAAGWPGAVDNVIVGGSESQLRASSSHAQAYGFWSDDSGSSVLVTAPLPRFIPEGLPRWTAEGERIRFIVSGLDSLPGAMVAMQTPSMDIADLVPDSAGYLEFCADQTGIYWLEVLGQDDDGPEVLMLLPLICGGDWADVEEGRIIFPRSLASTPGEILAEINSLRRGRGLDTLARSPHLDSLAGRRAVDLAIDGGSSHLFGAGESIQGLLPDTVDYYAENISRGAGYAEAWSMIMISPFHLRSCLSPGLSRFGSGSAVQLDEDRWQLVLVQLLTGSRNGDR